MKRKRRKKELKHKRISKLIALAVCFAVSASTLVSAGAVEVSESGSTFIEKMDSRFQDPGMEYKPEIRWWLAEGSHTDETLLESIHEMYDAGYGAIEFVTLDESNYLENETYAWGSEEWIHDSHLIIKECTRLGMGVSFTSGTNWGTANLMSITPDEESALQELAYTTVPVAAGETYQGELPLPALPDNVTKATLVSITAAQVLEDGTTLAEDSFTDITGQAAQAADGTWKITYTAPQDGNYIVFAYWQHGVGETFKPAVSNSYTINYFSKEGAQALIEYWQADVLDEELRDLIRENGDVSLFMDSLEFHVAGKNTTGNLWCSDYLDEFEARRGYDLTPYLPLILMPKYGFNADIKYAYQLDSNAELADKVRRDVYQTNTDLYTEECLEVIREWTHSFGMTLRAQNSYGQLLETSQPIKSIDYVESESLNFGAEIDAYRTMSGGAHLYNIPYSSETGAITSANYWNNSEFFRQLYYTQFASGINRTVLHGYASGYGPEENVSWPGYEGMSKIFSERFTKRQPNAIDYVELNEHLARIQKALRLGVPQMDIGILRTDYYHHMMINFFSNLGDYSKNDLRKHTGVYWQDTTLQDAGYTYDYFSPNLLREEDVTCENGLVQADGVGYQALILYQEELPYESAEILLNWAENGLPLVIVEGSTEERVRSNVVKYNESGAITTGSNDGKDEQLAALMTQIKALDSVAVVQTEAEAYDALLSLGVRPRAEYVESGQQNLLSVLRKDSDASYLYVYNYMYQDEQNYTGQISLDGIYKPYLLNTWTGETEEIAQYAVEDGRTVLNVDIAPGEVMIFTLDPNSRDERTITGSSNVEQIKVENGQTTMLVSQSGTAKLTYSDGSTFETEVTAPEDLVLNDWSLVVEDWLPGEKVTRTEDRGLGYTTTEVTYTTKKSKIDVGSTELKPWNELEAVGPNVSGVGSYTTTFTLPLDWSKEQQGLIFNAESFCGGTAALFVNGQQVSLNMDSRSADISPYAVPGENTLEVRVTSSLRNRMIEQKYSGWLFHFNPQADSYGMTGQTTLTTYVKVAATSSGADKTILDRVIAYAEAQYADPSFSNVIEDVQKSFAEALQSARSVSANSAADQSAVDTAWKALMTEIHKLGFVQGDKQTLSDLIALAETFSAQVDKYTPVTAEPFVAALADAKAVFSDGNAMQGDVETAEAALLDAMMNLRYKADKSLLESVLAKASELDTSAYTAESVQAFYAAIQTAESVNRNENATQAEVNDAAQALQNAVNGLSPAEPVSDSVVQGDSRVTVGSGNAKTGDTLPFAAAVSLFTLLGAGLILSKKK